MRKTVPSLLCLGLALAPFPAAALTADSAKVYSSPRGEEVDVVMLQPAAEGSAVIRMSGTNSPLDGMALLYKRTVERDREFFTTTWHGRNFSFVLGDHRHGERWELTVPGDMNHTRHIAYDDKLTKALQVATVLALYDRQLKDGSLTKLATFNRGEEQAGIEKTLRESAAEAEKACGAPIATRISWPTITDQVLKSYSISSYCGSPLSAMATLCKQSKVAAAILHDKVKEVSCSFASPMKLAVSAGKLDWSVDTQSSNLDEFAKQHLEAMELSPPAAARAGESPPWGDAHTLGQRIILSKTGVCTDGKNHVIISSPPYADPAYLYYGDNKQLTKVQLADERTSGRFFEPRYQNPAANPNYNGIDDRNFSAVDFDADKQTCSIRCGARKTELTVMPAAAATDLLTAANFLPARKQYVAHVLTRDDRGNYYYVDKGSTPETKQQFRLFIGPKGGLKLQRMTNVVSDSQGEIFSTKTGDLRLIVGPQGKKSVWVKGGQRSELLPVPIEENWNMIWTDLGVYTGEKRGNPCDDL